MLNRFGIPMCQPEGGKQCAPENTDPKFKVGDIVQIIKASNSDYEQEIGKYGPIKGIEEGLLSTLYSVDLYIGTPQAGMLTIVNEDDLGLFNMHKPQVKPPPRIQSQFMQPPQPPQPPNMHMDFGSSPPPKSIESTSEYKVCLYELLPTIQSYSCDYYTIEEQNDILRAYNNKTQLSFIKYNSMKEQSEMHTFNFVYDNTMPHNKQYTLIKVPKNGNSESVHIAWCPATKTSDLPDIPFCPAATKTSDLPYIPFCPAATKTSKRPHKRPHKLPNWARYDIKPSSYQRFSPGDKFYDTQYDKTGIVIRLRDDSSEEAERRKDKTHYFYSVKYDDGTYETYLTQNYMAEEKLD